MAYSLKWPTQTKGRDTEMMELSCFLLKFIICQHLLKYVHKNKHYVFSHLYGLGWTGLDCSVSGIVDVVVVNGWTLKFYVSCFFVSRWWFLEHLHRIKNEQPHSDDFLCSGSHLMKGEISKGSFTYATVSWRRIFLIRSSRRENAFILLQ